MDDLSNVSDNLLAHGLLSAVCASLNAGSLDPQLTDSLRFRIRGQGL